MPPNLTLTIIKITKKLQKFLSTALLFTVLITACTTKPKVTPDTSGRFIKLFGNAQDQQAYALDITPDGGFICLGTTIDIDKDLLGNDIPNPQTYLVKTDINGNKIWAKKFISGTARDVKVTPDGGYIVLGDTTVVRNPLTPNVKDKDFYLLKVDANGVKMWDKIYGTPVNPAVGLTPAYYDDDLGYNISVSANGEMLFIGKIDLGTKSDAFVFRTNATGNLITETVKRYGFSETKNDIGTVQEALNGNYIWCGTTRRLGRTDDEIRIAPLERTTNAAISDYVIETEVSDETGQDVKDLGFDNYVVLGTTNNATISKGGKDIYLLKAFVASGAGNDKPIWQKAFGGTLDDEGKSVAVTKDGGFIITGYTQTDNKDNADIILIKTNSEGVEQWRKTFGGEKNDFGVLVKQLADGGYVILGTTRFDNNDMMCLIRTNAQGEILK